MKRIIAIIQPCKLEAVENALVKAGISGVNLTDVMGFGKQKEPAETYLGIKRTVRFVPKTKVEVVVPDKGSHDNSKPLWRLAAHGARKPRRIWQRLQACFE